MKQCILLLEDNDFIRENAVELLELADYDVVAAEDGAKGLELLKTIKPDLILCDIQMPGMNGYEFFTTIKVDKSIASIPFIFLTAHSEKRDIEKALELGALDYIVKPFDADELIRVVGKYLQKTASTPE